jgi:hypothetical protein
MNAEEFWRWFAAQEPQLRGADGQVVADAVEARLREIDPRVGVEVSDPGDERELIFTAWSQREAFPVVHALMAAAPRGLAGWRLIALKPPRGFGFAIDVEGLRIDASQLRFDPLASPQAPGALGVRVYVAGAPAMAAADEQWAQTLALIIETGIGEDAAAQIDYLEPASGTPDAKSLPIDELLPLVHWHRRKHAMP